MRKTLRLKKTHRKHKGGALCLGEGDIYTLGEKVAEDYEFDNVLFSFFKGTDHDVNITKMVCVSNNPVAIGKAYVDMYKVIKLANAWRVGPKILFSKICNDENMKPVAYIVYENKTGVVGGALCNSQNIWTPGKQIGQAEQIGESEDPLHIAKNDENFIIKKLTGGGDRNIENSGDIAKLFTDIYTEIKLTIRAGAIGVGPKIVFSQICSDSELLPVGYLVMERIYGSYVREKEIIEHKDEIKAKIDTLYENRINHQDMHNRNVMFGTTVSQAEPRIWIIDYGTGSQTPKVLPVKDRDYVVSIISDANPNDKMKPVSVF